jgi:hypothetical protein
VSKQKSKAKACSTARILVLLFLFVSWFLVSIVRFQRIGAKAKEKRNVTVGLCVKNIYRSAAKEPRFKQLA